MSILTDTEGDQELGEGLAAKFFVLAGLEETEAKIHDADTLEITDLVAQRGTHATDLVFLTLGQDDLEDLVVDRGDDAGLGLEILELNPLAHPANEEGVDFLVDPDDVFFLVGVFRIEHLVGDTTVIGHDHQPLRSAVEPPHRKHVGRKTGDVLDAFLSQKRGVCRDLGRFVVEKVAILLPGLLELAVHFHDILLIDLVPDLGGLAVDGHKTLLDQLVGFAPAGIVLDRQVTVESHRVSRRFQDALLLLLGFLEIARLLFIIRLRSVFGAFVRGVNVFGGGVFLDERLGRSAFRLRIHADIPFPLRRGTIGGIFAFPSRCRSLACVHKYTIIENIIAIIPGLTRNPATIVMQILDPASGAG